MTTSQTSEKTSFLKGIIMGLGFLLTQLTISLYMPALPSLETIFNVPHQAALATVTFLLLGYGIGQLAWGSLSDHYGRRPVMIVTLLCYGLSIIAVSFAQQLWFFSLALSTAGFFIASVTSVGNAILRDIYDKKRATKVLANISIAMASGPVIAPFIGSHLLHWFGWQSIFIFLFLLSVVFFLGFLWIRETHHQRSTAQAETDPTTTIYKEKLSNKKFLGFIITLGLIFGCLISFISVAPFIFMHFYHMSLQTFGEAFLLASFSNILSVIIYSRLSHRIKPEKIVTLGTLLASLGLLGLSFVAYSHQQQTWLLVLMTAIVMSGFGLVLPAAKVGAMTIFHQHNGATASLMKIFQVFLGVIVTLVASHLYSPHSFFHFILFYLLVLVAAIVLQWLCWRQGTHMVFRHKQRREEPSRLL